MTPSDLAAADELRALAGWNQTVRDWERLLLLEPEGCFAVEEGGRVVGTATTTSYGTDLAWIGMVLVHPDHRRRGIARALMARALEHLQGRGVRSIKLDASPAGLPLYEELGFAPEWGLTRFQAELGAAPGATGPSVRPLLPSDLKEVLALDRRAFGASRERLIGEVVRGCRRAFVHESEGRITGYGILRPGAVADGLGPLVALTDGAPQALLPVLLAARRRPAVFWDVPDTNQGAATLARELGFRPQRALTRMRLGPDQNQGDVPMTFAIADPGTG